MTGIIVLDHKSRAKIMITEIVVPNNIVWLKRELRYDRKFTAGLLPNRPALVVSLVNVTKLQARPTIIQNRIKSVTLATPNDCSTILAINKITIPIRKSD